MFVRKERAGIHGVEFVTMTTAIGGHMATTRFSKAPRLFDTGVASWTMQAMRVKILVQPLFGKRVIGDLKQWKVHAEKIVQ